MDVKIIVALIGLVGVFLAPFIKFFLDKINNVKTFDEEAEISRIVNNELTNIKHEFGALRVFVNQYHNGGEFYSGQSRQKLSMTFETYDEKTAHSILPKFQDMPITYFSSMVYELNSKGKVVQNSIENIQDSSFRRILKEEGVYSHYAFAFYKDIWYFKWHPIFFRKKRVMVSTLHIYFDHDIEMDELKRINLEVKVNNLSKYLS